MKKIFKPIYFVIGILFLYGSCETVELDLKDNPNALSPEQSDVEFFLNAIQVNFPRLLENDFARYGSELTRIDYLFGRDYRNAYSPTAVDFEWSLAYRGILADIRAMNNLAEPNEQWKHIAIGQVIEAMTITTLVDFFGDIPYSEALQGAENLNPKVDPGAEVYAAALALLDEAIVNFGKQAPDNPDIDFYYNKDYSKWIKLANTLKMEIYLNTRLVDPGAVSSFNSIVATGNYITTIEDDFQFRYGTNAVQPDTRHPRYASNYLATGGNDYISNWLANLMLETDDPRKRYYFYRQVSTVPGQDGTPPNEVTLDCSLQEAPQHYQDGGFTFCGLPNGYWGRDHGEDAGIPPDGLLRTLPGVYPAGGLFDDNSFTPGGLGAGGGGAGITPIVLSSWVDFWQAEIAMVQNDPATALQEILSGIDKSITKVQSFASLDNSADLSFEPESAEVAEFKALIEQQFTSGNMETKWNTLAEQFWVSLYGNGIDAYNFYRRTGYPTTLQPNIEPNPGNFVRSFFYPANFVNSNSSVTQKPDVSVRVFWDTNPASPGFPESN